MPSRIKISQNSLIQALLGIHILALVALLYLAMLVGLFPIAVVCDGGSILTCLWAGVLFFSAVAGSALATVGGAIVALKRPGKLSQYFLLMYSMLLIEFKFYNMPSVTNFGWLRTLAAALGIATLISVIFFGAGRKYPDPKI